MFLVPVLPHQEAPAPSIAVALNSLVKVRAHLAQGDLDLMGGGVVVAPGLVATNAHVAAAGLSITVEHGAERWRATGIRVDRELDLCLITVPGLTLPPAKPSPGDPEPGETVFAVGFPGGRGPVVSRGRLRARWYYRDGRLLQSDVETHPGSSGGGLFDSRGCLLGLTTFTAKRSPRLSFSLSLEGVRALEAQPIQGFGQGTRHGLAQAEDYLTILAEDPRNGPIWEPTARAWIAAEPQSPDAWFALGLALDQVSRRGAANGVEPKDGSVHESVEAYRRALALRPDVRAWNNLGVALDSQNRFPEAEQAFGEALKLRPDYALAWMNLGSTRLNAQRFHEAAEAYERGLAIWPDDGQAWVRLAECHRKLKAWGAEIQVLDVALRYQPLSPELWLDFGAAHAHLGHREEAETALRWLNARESPLADRLKRVMKRSFRRR